MMSLSHRVWGILTAPRGNQTVCSAAFLRRGAKCCSKYIRSIADSCCQGQGNSVGPEEMPKGHKCTAGEHPLPLGLIGGPKAVPSWCLWAGFLYPESVI